MKSLICPISTERISLPVVRLTGFMMATLIALYILSGNVGFIILAVLDYSVRAFTRLRYSPASWAAAQIAGRFISSPKQIDKAPKIFAARVGWLFAVTTAVLAFIHPTSSIVVGATLMSFALLESIFDICMGCLVYTYIVLPLVGES